MIISPRLKVIGVGITGVVALTMFLEVSQATPPSSAPVSISPVQVRLPVDDATGKAPPDPGAPAAAAYIKPQVPADQMDRAMATLSADAVFKKLLGTHSFTVLSSTPWTDGSGTANLGVGLSIRLSAPVSASVGLPAVNFHADERAYDQVVQHVHFDNASEFDVLVDLSANRLVRLAPTDASETAQPGYPVPVNGATADGPTGD